MELIDKLKKQLNIIYAGLFIGQVAFAAVTYFIIKPEYVESTSNDMLSYVAIGLLTAGAVFGRLFGNKRLTEIREMNNETAKSQAYVGLSIIRYASLEGPILFCIVMYMQTGVDVFLYLICGGLLYFLSLIPRASLINSELRITR